MQPITIEDRYTIFAAYFNSGFITIRGFEGIDQDYKKNQMYGVSPTALADIEVGGISSCRLVLIPLTDMPDAHKLELWNYIFPEDLIMSDGTKILNCEALIRFMSGHSSVIGVRFKVILKAIAKLMEWSYDVGYGQYTSLIEAGIAISSTTLPKIVKR